MGDLAWASFPNKKIIKIKKNNKYSGCWAKSSWRNFLLILNLLQISSMSNTRANSAPYQRWTLETAFHKYHMKTIS